MQKREIEIPLPPKAYVEKRQVQQKKHTDGKEILSYTCYKVRQSTTSIGYIIPHGGG